MKNSILFAILFIPFTTMGQSSTEGSSSPTEIKELKFPYRKGYHMFFKGEVIQYDRYNFPANSKPSWFTYYIADEVKEKDRWIVNFQLKTVSDTDTVTYNTTYLYIDDEGMYFWLENDPSNVHNGRQLDKKEKEKKTQGIALPLTAGMHWKSFDYGSDKADFYCSTIDTVIELKKGGPVHCFSVTSTATLDKAKDYTVYRRSIDYYNQEIGKVATNMLVYLILSDGKTKKVSEESYWLEDYYTD